MELIQSYLETIKQNEKPDLIDAYLSLTIPNYKIVETGDSWDLFHESMAPLIVVAAPRRSGKSYNVIKKILNNHWNNVLLLRSSINAARFVYDEIAQQGGEILNNRRSLRNTSVIHIDNNNTEVFVNSLNSISNGTLRGMRFDAAFIEDAGEFIRTPSLINGILDGIRPTLMASNGPLHIIDNPLFVNDESLMDMADTKIVINNQFNEAMLQH